MPIAEAQTARNHPGGKGELKISAKCELFPKADNHECTRPCSSRDQDRFAVNGESGKMKSVQQKNAEQSCADGGKANHHPDPEIPAECGCRRQAVLAPLAALDPGHEAGSNRSDNKKATIAYRRNRRSERNGMEMSPRMMPKQMQHHIDDEIDERDQPRHDCQKNQHSPSRAYAIGPAEYSVWRSLRKRGVRLRWKSLWCV